MQNKGINAYNRMHDIVEKLFAKNEFHAFHCRYLPNTGSIILSCNGKDSSFIKAMVHACIADGISLLGNYGYTAMQLPHSGKVHLINFDLYTNAKWNQIWRKR